LTHVNDIITEHSHTSHGVKTTGGTSTRQPLSTAASNNARTVGGFHRWHRSDDQSPGCSGHVRLTANHSSMQLKLHNTDRQIQYQVAHYILICFTCLQTVTRPSTNWAIALSVVPFS